MNFNSCGIFKKNNIDFNKTVLTALSKIDEIMVKNKKYDSDSFINEIRDGYIGNIFGFNYINTYKHGFDCKSEDNFLESKVTNYNNKTWSATFNDTTIDKCHVFEQNNAYLALSVWNGFSDCVCVAYGKISPIVPYLMKGIERFENRLCKRSSQSISFWKLCFDYNYDIYAINRSKEEILNMLIIKNKNFQNYSLDKIHEIKI